MSKFWSRRLSAVAVVVAAVGMTATLAGCGGGGDDGPQRYDVSGTINYKAQPVPSGTIYFDPAPGNDGPQGYAQIQDGEFDTSAGRGKGVAGGPHIIRVEAPGFKYTAPQPVDLPKESSEQRLDLDENEVTVIQDAPEV